MKPALWRWPAKDLPILPRPTKRSMAAAFEPCRFARGEPRANASYYFLAFGAALAGAAAAGAAAAFPAFASGAAAAALAAAACSSEATSGGEMVAMVKSRSRWVGLHRSG